MSGSIRLGRCIRAIAGAAIVAPLFAVPVLAQSSSDVTFAKDIAPILQRSCQNCHRADGGAPMPLTTYEEVRPWARSIKMRTAMGPKAGVMPPWYVEKNIGIQKFQDDPSLNAKEIAIIAKWADSGAPLGNPADLPPGTMPRSGQLVNRILSSRPQRSRSRQIRLTGGARFRASRFR